MALPFCVHGAAARPSPPDHRGMIGYAIIMLVVAGVFSALAGFVGRDMRDDVRERDEVADLYYVGPRASDT
jgi:hypothetical protein